MFIKLEIDGMGDIVLPGAVVSVFELLVVVVTEICGDMVICVALMLAQAFGAAGSILQVMLTLGTMLGMY